MMILFLLLVFCTYASSWINFNSPITVRQRKPVSKLFGIIYGYKAPIQYDEPIYVVNEDITHREVRLVIPSEETGEDVVIGVYPIEAARSEAERMEKDLVLVNDKTDPPICKIVEFGKYRYEMHKKIKEKYRKERDKKVVMKEIKMTYKIDIHDLQVRIKAIQRFLADGDKVRVLVQFQGRERSFYDLGIEMLNKIAIQLKDLVVVESPPQVEGAGVAMIIAPKKTKQAPPSGQENKK